MDSFNRFPCGVVIIALPDKAASLIQLNEMHGPSAVDIAGLAIIFISWLFTVVKVFAQWKKICSTLRKKETYGLVVLYFVFIAGIATALMLSLEWVLWLCVFFAAVINGLFMFFAFRR